MIYMTHDPILSTRILVQFTFDNHDHNIDLRPKTTMAQVKLVDFDK